MVLAKSLLYLQRTVESQQALHRDNNYIAILNNFQNIIQNIGGEENITLYKPDDEDLESKD